MKLEIVERSSGYWIVHEWGVAWLEPFVELADACAKLTNLELLLEVENEKKSQISKIKAEKQELPPFK